MDNQQIKNFIETSRQSGISDDKIVSYLQSKGVNLQGQQEQPKSFGQKALDTAKATVGGFASGVGGVALTAEDYLARKGVFGEKVKTAMQGQPSLQEQFKKEMGGNESPTAYGIGQLGGEIASLAAPVSAVGSATSKGVQALGAGKNVAKLAQAGTEGVAFTAGQSLTEGEKMPLKDYAINAGLNMLIPAGGIVAKKAGENLPSRIVNSLIKPLQKDFAYGKNPGRVIADKGIVANNFEELITKVKQAKDETGNVIGEFRAKSTTPITLDAESVIKPIDQAIAKANLTPRTNAALIQRLESVRQDILENIDNGLPPEQVKSLVGDLTKWTGNATDDQLVNKSLKGVYGSINSQMDDALKTGLSPEDFNAYKKANEQYGDLISAENASVYRDKILERQDLISFGAKNAGLITALSTAIATGGSAIPTILAGLGGAILDKTMATPAFKTRLAVLLRKLAPTEVNTFFEKVPTAKTLFNGDEIDNLINKVKETPNKQGGFAKLPYEGSKPKATTNSLTTTASKTATDAVIPKSSPKSPTKSIPNKQGGFISTGTQEGLTTKLLNDLEGRNTATKQYIEQRIVSGDLNLKQIEKDLARQVLDTMPDKINVQKFADKMKAELLPLKRQPQTRINPEATNFGAKYESITLPNELRGNVKNYSENIYESPIKTSAGNVHFGQNKNYFGHTRIEDMADNKTRRVIEVQSDLYQKGNLEREAPKTIDSFVNYNGDTYRVSGARDGKLELSKNGIKPFWVKEGDVQKNTSTLKREGEIAKLSQYNDPTAHFRMIREEIKKAAEDGKTKLQFPTGETAMKIEGLGDNTTWFDERGGLRGQRIKPEELRVGKAIVHGTDGNDWIITDVLGDGKFKAVHKDNLPKYYSDLTIQKNGKEYEILDPVRDDIYDVATNKVEAESKLQKIKNKIIEELNSSETFDISGNVDTNNPIYRFYEKDMGKYLTSKYKAKIVTDSKGIKWYQIDVTPEMKKSVEAFGKIQGGILYPIAVGSAALVAGKKLLGGNKK